MVKNKTKMLDCFPNHKYRYIDQTGESRSPVSSNEIKPELNRNGYESYFTVNGFKDCADNKKDQCTNINAFFVDIDGRKNEKELEDIKKILDPSFITETKNGYHIFWLLDESIYKEELSEEAWSEAVSKWEKIEQSIVTTLKADPVVKDITRILRIPDTYYWKKTGDAYKKGLDGAIKIKGIYKNLAATYTMEQVAEAFPIKEESVNIFTPTPITGTMKKYADAEKMDFFNKVNEKYPIEHRDSFKRLISGKPDTLPNGKGERNQALLITATLMRQARWTKAESIEHINKVGWHGIEKENGGKQEILNTINSAYQTAYTYSYKNEIIAFNMSPEEQSKIQTAYTAVAKDRREVDKTRFSNYEREILSKYPYLKKNEIGIVFNYDKGVYKMMTDQDLSVIILNGLYEDMLWGYRTKRNVADKVACLISIIPDLKITNDGGYVANVKNGLLNINTRELKPHTPEFVSLIQHPINFDPTAECPYWNECMKRWTEGEEQDGKYLLLQQFAGYCLSSSVKYQKALFLVGDGGHGKSTFEDTIGMIMGEEATSNISLEDLYSPFGLKGLIGKRINIVEEIESNYYQSHILKKLISGEEITINMKYKDQFKFRPQVKFIFACNSMPRVDDSSTATERRICAVKFETDFKDKPNMELRGKGGLLAQELPGILNWMLDGAMKLREMGKFIVTEEQTRLLKEYREENSSVEGFMGECVDFVEGETITARELYEEYKIYCQKDGRKYKSSMVFTKEIRYYGSRTNKLSFHERESGHDSSRFEGICINESWKDNSLGNYQSRLKDF